MKQTETAEKFDKLAGLVMTEYKAKRYERALELFNWCLPVAHQLGDWYKESAVRNGIASCYHHLGRLREAIALSEAVLLVVSAEGGPDHELAKKCRSRINKCKSAQNEQRADKLWDEARAHYRRHDFKKAATCWVDCAKFKVEPSPRWNAMRLVSLAMCHHCLGHWHNAQTLMSQAKEIVDATPLTDEEDATLFNFQLMRIRISFEAAEAYELLDEFQVLLDQEDFAGAEGAAEAALVEVDKCYVGRDCYLGARILDRLGYVCYKQERYTDARQHWQEAQRLAERWAGKEQSDLAGRIRDNIARLRMH